MRSEAGGQDIYQRDHDADGPSTSQQQEQSTYCNNSHWLPENASKESNHVAYYDAASLYPTSGTIFFTTKFVAAGQAGGKELGKERKGGGKEKAPKTLKKAPKSQPTLFPFPSLPPSFSLSLFAIFPAAGKAGGRSKIVFSILTIFFRID